MTVIDWNTCMWFMIKSCKYARLVKQMENSLSNNRKNTIGIMFIFQIIAVAMIQR